MTEQTGPLPPRQRALNILFRAGQHRPEEIGKAQAWATLDVADAIRTQTAVIAAAAVASNPDVFTRVDAQAAAVRWLRAVVLDNPPAAIFADGV